MQFSRIHLLHLARPGSDDVESFLLCHRCLRLTRIGRAVLKATVIVDTAIWANAVSPDGALPLAPPCQTAMTPPPLPFMSQALRTSRGRRRNDTDHLAEPSGSARPQPLGSLPCVEDTQRQLPVCDRFARTRLV